MILRVIQLVFAYSILLFSIDLFAQEHSNLETKIFGVSFKGCHINEMRLAIIQGGGSPLDEGKLCIQKFDSSKILEESKELKILSDKEGKVAHILYKMEPTLDIEQVTRVRELVESKYGSPSFSSGFDHLPMSVEHWWQLDDGVTVYVKRNLPDISTYLGYICFERADKIEKEIEEIKKEQDNFKSIYHAI